MAQKSDCGKACCQMLTKWKMGQHWPIASFTYETNPEGMTSPANIVQNLALAGLTAKVWTIPTDQEAPPGSACLVKYSGFNRDNVQDKKFMGWHWVVRIGFRNGKHVLHDPNRREPERETGAFWEVSPEEWSAAFIPYPGNPGRVYVALV